jgi:hypothetical protein
VFGILGLATLLATPAFAQLSGENLLGDMGVKSGTQPAPGLYIGSLYYNYRTETIKGPDGKTVALDPTGAGSQTIHAAVPLVIYVSPKKILGANFGMMTVIPFANGSIEAPGFGLSEKASTGASDLYVQPAQLGWHGKRFDAIAGFAFFAPTGRYESGASDNLGKNMWSYETSGGATFYFDRARSLSFATTAYWETHTRKDGSALTPKGTINNVKVGDLMTLEGGLGKSFLKGAASVGLAYYAQWKLTGDELTLTPPSIDLTAPDKHRVAGLGPDVTLPIATKTKLIALVNVRYLWETGARVKTQGQSLLVTASFPVGGIPIGQ